MSSLDKAEIGIAVVVGALDLPLGSVLRLGRGARLRLESQGVEAVEVLAAGTAIGVGRLVQGRAGLLAVEISQLFNKPGPNGRTALQEAT